jgi:hypothetical protein
MPAAAALDQTVIQSVVHPHRGEKPLPPGMLVGRAERLPMGFLVMAVENNPLLLKNLGGILPKS